MADNRFFLVGDVHGALDELNALLAQNDDRMVVFVGDLTDRGPNSVGVLRRVMSLVNEGRALAVMGNHDDKLRRFLSGNNVTPAHGLETTVAELASVDADERAAFLAFLSSLPFRLDLDNGRLVVVHAAAPSNVSPKKARAAALFGVTNGEVDANGFPVRLDWAAEHDGDTVVVHGHVTVDEVTVKNNVWNLDTGAVFGGKLTGLMYPEMELKQVVSGVKYAHD